MCLIVVDCLRKRPDNKRSIKFCTFDAIKIRRLGGSWEKVCYSIRTLRQCIINQSLPWLHSTTVSLNSFSIYSLNLASPDFHMFSNMKEALAITHFYSNNDIIAAVENFSYSQEKDFYETEITVIKTFQHFWKKCINVDGDSVEYQSCLCLSSGQVFLCEVKNSLITARIRF